MLHLLTYFMTAPPLSGRVESWAAVPSFRVRGAVTASQSLSTDSQTLSGWELDGGTRSLILLPDCIESEKN